jgi:hypothetical protein
MVPSISPSAILLLSTVLSTANVGCHGYIPSSSSSTSRTLWTTTSRAQTGVGSALHLSSSTTKKKSTEDAFSAFANSLEEEPVTGVGAAEKTKKGKPWQTKLEDLLDPSTNMADRQVLLSELMSSNEDIRDSVMDALTKREVCVCVCLCSVFRVCRFDTFFSFFFYCV